MHGLWSAILQVGSISGLLALALNIIQGIKNTPCFKYEFQDYAMDIQDAKGRPLEENGSPVSIQRFSGIIRNQSTSVNSLNHIHIIIWRNARRSSVKSMRMINSILDKNEKESVYLPR